MNFPFPRRALPLHARARMPAGRPGADLILREAGTTVAERIPMPVDDAPAVWTEGRSAVVSAQAAVDGQSLILPETRRP